MTLEEIKRELARLGAEQRREVFRHLRQEFPIHQLETEYRVSAEVILEAIARAPDITQRGIRGIIAEAVFVTDVLPQAVTAGWVDTTPPNTENHSFDARLSRDGVDVRIQVKTQRKEKGAVLERIFPSLGRCYIAETQRTRSGRTTAGKSTRPYRDDEFDILAVCMFPATGDWRHFSYALVQDLVRRPRQKHLPAVFQPIPREPIADRTWSADLTTKLADFFARRKAR